MTNQMILVEMPWGRDKDPRVPLGHASLIAVLNMKSEIKYHSVVKPINDKDFDVRDVFNEIQEIMSQDNQARFDIAFGVYVWAEEAIQALLQMLRSSDFSGRIILGGPQISYCGEGLEKHYPEADVFVRGYGEFAISALADGTENIDMPGIHYSGSLDLNEQTIVDLDLLPSPWLSGVIELENQPFIRWESQRGCPFKCGFCQHKEAGARLVKREFKSSRVMDEVDLFCEKNVSDIAVLDPIFNSSSQATEILQRFHSNDFTGRLSLQCRAEMADADFIDLASKLDVCLEFGLQTIHKNEGKAVNRINNMRVVEEVIDTINEKQIEYEISLIYGLPEQSIQSFRETVDWCLSKSVPIIKAFPLMLLRGTEVEQRKEEWGLVESEGSMPVVIQSNSFTHEEWCEMAKISEALKQTEGNHPKSIQELLAIAGGLDIDLSRYRPEISTTKGRDIVFRGGYSDYRLHLSSKMFESYCLSQF